MNEQMIGIKNKQTLATILTQLCYHHDFENINISANETIVPKVYEINQTILSISVINLSVINSKMLKVI